MPLRLMQGNAIVRKLQDMTILVYKSLCLRVDIYAGGAACNAVIGTTVCRYHSELLTDGCQFMPECHRQCLLVPISAYLLLRDRN